MALGTSVQKLVNGHMTPYHRVEIEDISGLDDMNLWPVESLRENLAIYQDQLNTALTWNNPEGAAHAAFRIAQLNQALCNTANSLKFRVTSS
jgi:hypothetical protein